MMFFGFRFIFVRLCILGLLFTYVLIMNFHFFSKMLQADAIEGFSAHAILVYAPANRACVPLCDCGATRRTTSLSCMDLHRSVDACERDFEMRLLRMLHYAVYRVRSPRYIDYQRPVVK